MNVQHVNRWLQLVANLGVIGGLVFLALELRQNTKMMAAQTRSDLTQSILALIEMERDPPQVAAYMKFERGETLAAEDRWYLDTIANATLRHWENTFYQHRIGLFDEMEFRADREVWREAMSQPHFQEHWKKFRHTYSAQFRQMIDNVVDAGAQ